MGKPRRFFLQNFFSFMDKSLQRSSTFNGMNMHLAIATHLVDFFYNQFTFMNFKFGLYSLIDLIPGIGDVVSLLLAVYMIWIAKQLEVPQGKVNRMIGNIILDLSFGAVPLLGDVVDTLFRAHVKNLEILKEHAPKKTVPVSRPRFIAHN